ncbi:MAG: hypothetical protein JWO06_1558 [Bacteroidota bacterium]|nr:hypothetical protein [Bacteroidota bacterium]
MFKMNCLAVFVMTLCVSSCQKRTLCKSKTTNGGSNFIRLYENTYVSPESYRDAIQTLKSEGYTCDDSVAVFVQ